VIRELTKLEQEFKSNKQKVIGILFRFFLRKFFNFFLFVQSFQSQAWEKSVLEIQRVFFNFILWIVNDFMRFFHPLPSSVNHPIGKSVSSTKFEIDEIFDKEAYLKIFPLEDQTFMREFIFNTMMFSYFIGQTYEVVFL